LVPSTGPCLLGERERDRTRCDFVPDQFELTEADDGKLFKVQVLNTGEVRVARYHHSAIGGIPLPSPCFADPKQPDDYQRWLHVGWGAVPVSRVRE
jgi:hypothetical protein